jgi:uncharacterized iron-regulated membrane protein
MKFVGLLVLVVIGNAMSYGVTFSLVFWFLVGLGMVFFDVITHWMKSEISSSNRRRR